MGDSTSAETSAAIARLREDEFLADFATPLPRLAEAEADPAAGIGRFGELTRGAKQDVSVRFRVLRGDRERAWRLQAGRGRSQVSEGEGDAPDVELILTDEAWRSLASGSVSPLEVFLQGGMRVRGSVVAARRLARELPARGKRA
jgi:hypothetical protein